MKCVQCDAPGVNADYKVCGKCIAELLEESSKAKPIMSNLLCYVSSYFSSASHVKIHISCLRAFSDAEIFEARDLLFSTYQAKLGAIQKRKDTPNRTRAQAVMEDIITAFTDLDRKDKISPMCATFDIKQMPKNTPEEADIVCLLDKFRQFESRIVNFEKSQQFISDTYDVTNSKINVLESDLLKTKNDADTAIHLAKEAQTMINANKPTFSNAARSNKKTRSQ